MGFFIFSTRKNMNPNDFFTEQHHEAYSTEDHAIWQLLYERQMDILANRASSDFLAGLQQTGMTPEGVPFYAEITERLLAKTGWQLHPVVGIVPNDLFFKLLSEKKFPVTTWIRTRQQLEYLEEPDLFHDVFGHVPLLVDIKYCAFLEALGHLALKYIDNTLVIELLARLYWYTIEFGLQQTPDGIRIYGAGILSSPGESVYSLSQEPTKAFFNVQEIFHTPYIKEKFQSQYFIIKSLEQLYAQTPTLEALLHEELFLATTYTSAPEQYGVAKPVDSLALAATT
jgi:phenylalanine-4-hydroxylase